MNQSPRPHRSSPPAPSALAHRLARDAAALPGPSVALRCRILEALRESRARDERAPSVPPAAPTGPGVRIAALVAAALVVLLLWDPGRLPGSEAPDAPRAPLLASGMLVEGLFGWTQAVPAVGSLDRPLRSEMDHLVSDSARVAEGFASSLSGSPLAQLLTVRVRDVGHR